jgi:hypothetical protein
VPRSARVNARSRAPVAHGQRGLDHGLRFRPRHQHRRGDLQHKAPEFLAAENARYRLAIEPSLRQGVDRVDLGFGQFAFAACRELRMIKAECTPDEQACVELGRFDHIMRAQGVGQHATGGRNRHIRPEIRHRHQRMPSSAASSAA